MPSVSPPRLWKPLLEGSLARAARDAISDIALAIAGPPELPQLDGLPAPLRRARAASLADGEAGRAVLFAQLSLEPDGAHHAARAVEALERAIAVLAEETFEPGLLSGFAGIGWAAEHLGVPLGLRMEGEDPNQDIDAALLGALAPSPWRGAHDLVSGLVGLGVYLLERVPRDPSGTGPRLLVSRLAERSEPRPGGGVAWPVRPVHAVPHPHPHAPPGRVDLGLAHGMAGVVAFLGKLAASGIAADLATPLLERAVPWLLSCRHPASGSCFPYHVEADDSAGPPARSGWCYGDPGLAMALLWAARGAGAPAWEEQARELARTAAARPFSQAEVVDAPLCHGAAGLGHIFNRLLHATGDEALRDVARSWMARALEMRRPGAGVAGFLAGHPVPGGELSWLADPSLLTGAAGIALALHAAVTDIEPTWDRVLLLS